MLDIEDLRLTGEELIEIVVKAVLVRKVFSEQVADAALAKVLWGIQAWLEEWPPDNMRTLRHEYLRDQLLASGVARPEGD